MFAATAAVPVRRQRGRGRGCSTPTARSTCSARTGSATPRPAAGGGCRSSSTARSSGSWRARRTCGGRRTAAADLVPVAASWGRYAARAVLGAAGPDRGAARRGRSLVARPSGTASRPGCLRLGRRRAGRLHRRARRCGWPTAPAGVDGAVPAVFRALDQLSESVLVVRPLRAHPPGGDGQVTDFGVVHLQPRLRGPGRAPGGRPGRADAAGGVPGARPQATGCSPWPSGLPPAARPSTLGRRRGHRADRRRGPGSGRRRCTRSRSLPGWPSPGGRWGRRSGSATCSTTCSGSGASAPGRRTSPPRTCAGPTRPSRCSASTRGTRCRSRSPACTATPSRPTGGRCGGSGSRCCTGGSPRWPCSASSARGTPRSGRSASSPSRCSPGTRSAGVRGAFQDVWHTAHTQVALAATQDQLADTEQRAEQEQQLALRLQRAIMPEDDSPVETAAVGVGGALPARRAGPPCRRGTGTTRGCCRTSDCCWWWATSPVTASTRSPA